MQIPTHMIRQRGEGDMNRKIENRTKGTGAVLPAWYWSKGLHDAVLVKKTVEQTPGSIGDAYYQNDIAFQIDAACALFDTAVTEIVFYNCKELSEDCTLDGWIWKADELSRDGDKFLLSVVFRQGMETKTYRIRFRDCVVRKNGDGTAPD